MNRSGAYVVLACVVSVSAVAFGSSGAGVAEGDGSPPQAVGAQRASSSTEVERGHYLALVGDCVSCHTAEGGMPYAGGRPLDTGFGVIYSPNITSDRETGIGSWSADDFYRAMHRGHDDEGRHLYPAFPYPWFTRATRADVDAIKVFLNSVAPVHRQDKPAQLRWWMSWRPTIAGWNLLNFDEGEFQPDPARSEQWNRGAYLVQGLGHCGDCHTQKGYFGGADRADPLGGGFTKGGHDQGWFAPSLAAVRRSGLGDWSTADIVAYLKSGANMRTASAGPMSEVITNSTSHFHDDDLQAIAVYLKSLPPQRDERRITALTQKAVIHGQGIFTDQCAACHMHDGVGIPGFFPALMGSSAIQAREPATVVRIVLEGARVPGPAGQRAYIAMPAFGRKLDDRDIADVVSYIRNAWGNRASAVNPGTVATERKALAASQH